MCVQQNHPEIAPLFPEKPWGNHVAGYGASAAEKPKNLVPVGVDWHQFRYRLTTLGNDHGPPLGPDLVPRS